MKLKFKRKKVPVKVPTIPYLKKLFSEPKIHVAYSIDAQGNKKECVAKGCDWWVYFYFRNPITKKMSEKFILKKGINRLKTVKERRVASENLRLAVLQLLKDGFNPFEEETIIKVEEKTNVITIKQAFDIALESRLNEWKESSANVCKAHFNVILNWIEKSKLQNLPITELKRKNIVQFLDYLIKTREVNKTTRNNYKRTISSLLTKMIELELIEFNPADKIKSLKTNPKKNKAFSVQQLKDITNWLKTNDPYLHQYLKFVSYAFMRPIEVNRLKIENIDLEKKIISVDTKTGKNEIPIISTLEKVIIEMNLYKYDASFTVFTKKEKPFNWITEREKSKYDFFERRFKKLKNHFKLTSDYGIYSFRHNSALNLYHSFVKGGMQENEAVNKLQKIMRHSDSNTTRIYLRDIGAFAIDDYSEDYTFEF